MSTRTIAVSPALKIHAGHEIVHSWTAPNDIKIELQMFRSDKFFGADDDGYRPAKVMVNGVKAWTFQTSGIRPFADLIEIDSEPCPIIVGLNSKYVLSVLPTQDFETAHMITVNGMTKLVGGSSVERLLDLKIAIARGLDLEPNFTKNEQILVDERLAVERQAHLERQAQRTAEVDARREERLAARATFARELLARQIKVAYTATGEKRSGLPVMEDELPRLIGDRHYIIVDAEGASKSYFFLTDRKVRRGETEVSDNKSELNQAGLKPSTMTLAVSAEDIIMVKLGGIPTEVPLYKSSADVAAARKTWETPLAVAFREHSQGNPTGRICVVSASSKACYDLMVFEPKREPLAA